MPDEILITDDRVSFLTVTLTYRVSGDPETVRASLEDSFRPANGRLERLSGYSMDTGAYQAVCVNTVIQPGDPVP